MEEMCCPVFQPFQYVRHHYILVIFLKPMWILIAYRRIQMHLIIKLLRLKLGYFSIWHPNKIQNSNQLQTYSSDKKLVLDEQRYHFRYFSVFGFISVYLYIMNDFYLHFGQNLKGKMGTLIANMFFRLEESTFYG